jgi:hypothetical protein
LYDSVHVIDIDYFFSEELINLKKNQGKTRSCVLLLANEPPYFHPGTKISKQFTELPKILLQHQIYNCDFFVTCLFFSRVHDQSIEYLNKNHYEWSFYKFNLEIPVSKKLEQFIEPDNQKKKLKNSVTELFLEQCHMKFSHLNFTHRMHRQLFSKFLIRENLVRDNLVAINPFRPDQGRDRNTSHIKKPLIDREINDGWFYNKRLLDLWRDVPLNYHRHPDIDDNFDALDYTFLKKASFNIISETVFDYPEAFCTEKTTQSLMSKRPLIMIGPCGNLRYLRDRGFKTFHTILDESYDDIEDPNKRLEAIMQLVLDLNKKTQQELNAMVYEVKDILIHNYSLMRNKIKKTVQLSQNKL